MGKITSAALLGIAFGIFGCSQSTTATRYAAALSAGLPTGGAGNGNGTPSSGGTNPSGTTNPSGVDVVTAGINGAPITETAGNTDLASGLTNISISLGENDSTAAVLVVSFDGTAKVVGVAISGVCGSPTKVTTSGTNVLNVFFPPAPTQGSSGCTLALIASDDSETPFANFPKVSIPSAGTTPPGGGTTPPGGGTTPPGGGTTPPGGGTTTLASKMKITSISIGENDSKAVVLVVDATGIALDPTTGAPDILGVGVMGSCGTPLVPEVITIGLTGVAVAFPPAQAQGSTGCTLAIIASDQSETAFSPFPTIPVPSTGPSTGTGTIHITGATLFENDSTAVSIEFIGTGVADAAGDQLANCATADQNADAFPDADNVGLDFVFPPGDILGIHCVLTLFDSSNDPSNQAGFTVTAGTPLGALTLTPN